ncbi:hypothetical protein C8Q76DRAFT_753654 [Earliella scabrosa]|nr:hypothetical protein C8Q76DRAFT_753654 [Earliella scabrosa]
MALEVIFCALLALPIESLIYSCLLMWGIGWSMISILFFVSTSLLPCLRLEHPSHPRGSSATVPKAPHLHILDGISAESATCDESSEHIITSDLAPSPSLHSLPRRRRSFSLLSKSIRTLGSPRSNVSLDSQLTLVGTPLPSPPCSPRTRRSGVSPTQRCRQWLRGAEEHHPEVVSATTCTASTRTSFHPHSLRAGTRTSKIIKKLSRLVTPARKRADACASPRDARARGYDASSGIEEAALKHPELEAPFNSKMPSTRRKATPRHSRTQSLLSHLLGGRRKN